MIPAIAIVQSKSNGTDRIEQSMKHFRPQFAKNSGIHLNVLRKLSLPLSLSMHCRKITRCVCRLLLFQMPEYVSVPPRHSMPSVSRTGIELSQTQRCCARVCILQCSAILSAGQSFAERFELRQACWAFVATCGFSRFQISVLTASVWNVFSSILASKAHLIAVKNKLHLQHFPRHVAPLPGQVEELANQDLYLLL